MGNRGLVTGNTVSETGYYISSLKLSYIRVDRFYKKETNFAERTCLLQPFAPGSTLASVVTGILRIGPSPLALPRIKVTPHDYGTALAVTQRAKL